MKTIDKAALVGIILYLISWFLNAFRPYLINVLFVDGSTSHLGNTLFLMPLWFLSMIFNIAIAIWVFIIAKHYKTIPFVWALFGLFSGLLAPLLFYAIRIYETLTEQKKSSEPPN